MGEGAPDRGTRGRSRHRRTLPRYRHRRSRLMLGEPGALPPLAAVLRQFAREPVEGPIERSSIRLTASAGPLGIQVAAEPGTFLWRLDQAHAEAFAQQIDSLAQPSRVAGSEILECGTEEQIPVKVSC